MNLYTFIMNYEDGIYISQVNSVDETQAIQVWLKDLDIKSINGFTEKIRLKLIKEGLGNENPVIVDGCKNVWCICLKIKPKTELAIIHIIQSKE